MITGEYAQIQTFYPTVDFPDRISFLNDYKYPIHFDEKPLGSRYVLVTIEQGENFCVEDAYYSDGVAIDPPLYEAIPFETIIVQPKMRCWGKGV